MLCGAEPPARDGPFTWCELGFGQGVTAAIVAATHPAAGVYGIDAMPEHVARARELCRECGLQNISLHEALFGAAQLDALPSFDYIVAHGVYTWVSAAAQAGLRAFIDRHLKPGGLVYLSYNAMPGWAADLPLQRLLRELAGAGAGDSAARFASAAEIVGRMTDAGARALLASPMARSGLEQRRKTVSAAYFPHEFLPKAWQPRYVTDVRADLAEIGLEPIGSTVIRDNFDSYTIGKRGRDELAGVADPNLRELVRDYFRGTRFRRDLFGRTVRPLDDATRRARLRATTFHLGSPPERVTFRMTTAAGEVRFDTAAAHYLVEALAGGPRRLADLDDPRFPPGDLLANALALCAADAIRPVSPAPVPVDRVDTILSSREASPTFSYRVSPYGTAISVRLEGGAPDGESAAADADWITFLQAHGMGIRGR